MTAVIRAQCDVIDVQISGLTTRATVAEGERDTLLADKVALQGDLATTKNLLIEKTLVVNEQAAEIARLQAIIDGEPLPDPISMTAAPVIPVFAPVAGQPFPATLGVWVGGGGVAAVVHNWWVGSTFLSGNHANPFVPATGHVGKTLQYEEAVTFANGETRKFKTAPSLLVVAAEPDPLPDPEPTPDPDPVPDPDPEPQPTDGTVRIDVWMLPEATGDGSGSSPENAKAWSSLATTVGPDVHIGLIADKGIWPAMGHDFRKGGAAGAPSVITGVNRASQPRQVTLESGRTEPKNYADLEWPSAAVGGGTDVFDLYKNADHIAFRNIEFLDVDSAYRFMASVTGLEFTNQTLENVKEGWWMDNDPATGETAQRAVSHSIWKNIRAYGFEEALLRLYGASHHLRVEGIQGNSRRMMGNITIGIGIGKGDAARIDSVNNVHIIGEMHGCTGVIENCHDQHYEKPWMNPDGSGLSYAPLPGKVKNPNAWNSSLTMPGTKYWQGDSVSAERNCHDIILEKITGKGNCDSAFDIKSQNIKLIDCKGIDNKRNFRLWSRPSEQYPDGVLLDGCLSQSARKRGGSGATAHVYITGADEVGEVGPKITVRNMTFRGSPGGAFSVADAPATRGIRMTLENNTFDGVSGTPLPFVA